MVFTAALAGIPVQVRCRYEQNRDFLREYLSVQPPVLSIEPTPEDLARAREGLERIRLKEGRAPQSYSESDLENNAIHALLAEALTAHRVLLLHGSALCVDGAAVIFTAPSGTGKSTHARLWREAFGTRVWMINDDKPLLRFDTAGISVFGSPWNGKHRLSRNASAPLKAIVSLTRGAENRIAPMAPADAYQTLLLQAITSRNADCMRNILSMERELVDAIPFYRLQCNMERDAALVAWTGIFGSGKETGRA